MGYWMSATVKFVLRGKVSVCEFQRIVGRECDYENLREMNPWKNEELYLPLGSEGTLRIYPQSMSKKKTVYLVSGNISDKWDTKYTKAWFSRVTQNPAVIKAIGKTSLDSEPPEPLIYRKPRLKQDESAIL